MRGQVLGTRQPGGADEAAGRAVMPAFGGGLQQDPAVRPLAGWALVSVLTLTAAWILLQAAALAFGVARGPAYALGHAFGALILGLLLTAPRPRAPVVRDDPASGFAEFLPMTLCAICLAWPLGAMATVYVLLPMTGGRAPDWLLGELGWSLGMAAGIALISGWIVDGRGPTVRWPDLMLVLCAVVTLGYALLSLPQWQMRLGTPVVVPAHLGVAITGILLVLEILRRTTGPALPVFLLVLMAAALIGPQVPADLPLDDRSPAQLLTFAFFDEGIIGSGIAATIAYVAPLCVLAALLANPQVVRHLTALVAWPVRRGDLALGLSVGGLGLIIGHGRGLVDAAAPRDRPADPAEATRLAAILTLGGAVSRLLPVILGVSAYALASATGVALRRVIVELAIPAVLIAGVLLVSVSAAGGGGRRATAPRPPLADLLPGLLALLPFAALAGAVLAGQSGVRATLAAAAALLVVGIATAPRRTPAMLVQALATAGHLTVQIAAIGLASGVVVGMLVLSGVGPRVTQLVAALGAIDIAAAVAFALMFATLLALVLPTLAAYLVAASVFAPGLVQAGLLAHQAHVVLLYAICLAALLPVPLGLSEAAARLTGARTLRTAWETFRLGGPALLVPLLIVGHPRLLAPALDGAFAVDLAVSALGLWCLVVVWHGRIAGRPVEGALRGAFVAPIPLSVVGTDATAWLTVGLSVLLVLVWAVASIRRGRAHAARSPLQSAVG